MMKNRLYLRSRSHAPYPMVSTITSGFALGSSEMTVSRNLMVLQYLPLGT